MNCGKLTKFPILSFLSGTCGVDGFDGACFPSGVLIPSAGLFVSVAGSGCLLLCIALGSPNFLGEVVCCGVVLGEGVAVTLGEFATLPGVPDLSLF